MKLAKISQQIAMISIVFVLFLAILPVAISAQSVNYSLPAGVPDDTPGLTSTSAPAEGEKPTENGNQSNNRTQDFVTGLAVGVAIGLVVGSGTIWFTKKG